MTFNFVFTEKKKIFHMGEVCDGFSSASSQWCGRTLVLWRSRVWKCSGLIHNTSWPSSPSQDTAAKVTHVTLKHSCGLYMNSNPPPTQTGHTVCWKIGKNFKDLQWDFKGAVLVPSARGQCGHIHVSSQHRDVTHPDITCRRQDNSERTYLG